MRGLLLIVVLAVSGTLVAAGEREEVRRIAPKYGADLGTDIEVRLWDDVRADILPHNNTWTNEYAFEVDYAHKWAEAIGQSTLYAVYAKRRPAIILLWRKGDERHIHRALIAAGRYNIPVYLEGLPPEPEPGDE